MFYCFCSLMCLSSLYLFIKILYCVPYSCLKIGQYPVSLIFIFFKSDPRMCVMSDTPYLSRSNIGLYIFKSYSYICETWGTTYVVRPQVVCIHFVSFIAVGCYQESGLGLEHHLHRGRALAAFNHLLSIRVQKLKPENIHRVQSGSSVHGQTSVQSDVHTLLAPITQSEESVLASVWILLFSDIFFIY